MQAYRTHALADANDACAHQGRHGRAHALSRRSRPPPLERRPRLMHPYGMEVRGWIARHGFWPLAPFVPCGLPLALGCRRLWRLGYRRGAWIAGVALGAATVAVTLPAGLLGPAAIAVCAVLVGLPVWLMWWRLVWRG